MATKNGSTASTADDQTDQVTLRPVRLAKPARINGETYEAGEMVEVDATVGKQLYDADALDLEETEKLNKPAVGGSQA